MELPFIAQDFSSVINPLKNIWHNEYQTIQRINFKGILLASHLSD
jgi:hypothetical protein